MEAMINFPLEVGQTLALTFAAKNEYCQAQTQVQVLNPKSKVLSPEERDWDWG